MASDPHQTLDYLEAVEFYFNQGLTDGLPVVPPTPDRLAEFLDCVNLKPDDIVGIVPVGAIPITAEKVALNAVMAGCLPEYMPVIVTGIEAMVDDEFSLNATAASTSGSSHMLVVGGKVVDELGINYGVNMLGPGARANSTIGRAIRLILMNVCGALPGVLDKSTLGNPGKYTACIAEDESLTPWPPLRCDYGIPESQDAVTAFACYAPVQVSDHRSGSAEEVLTRIADAIVAYPLLRQGMRDHGHPRPRAPGPISCAPVGPRMMSGSSSIRLPKDPWTSGKPAPTAERTTSGRASDSQASRPPPTTS